MDGNGVVTARDYNPQIVAGRGPSPPSPAVAERMQSVTTQLFAQRIIRLGGAVDDDVANLLVAQMLYLDSQDPEADITMYINSPGEPPPGGPQDPSAAPPPRCSPPRATTARAAGDHCPCRGRTLAPPRPARASRAGS